MFTNTEPTDVRIDVVNRKDGTVVDSWIEHAQEPNTAHTATGTGSDSGASPPSTAPTGSGSAPRAAARSRPPRPRSRTTGSSSRSAAPTATGTASARPRSATCTRARTSSPRCNTKLVAARGGRVQWKAYQGSGAGNYLVIDGKKTEPRLDVRAPQEALPAAQGPGGPHRPADRRGRRDRRRHRLPPARRGVVGARAGTRAATTCGRSPSTSSSGIAGASRPGASGLA